MSVNRNQVDRTQWKASHCTARYKTNKNENVGLVKLKGNNLVTASRRVFVENLIVR